MDLGFSRVVHGFSSLPKKNSKIIEYNYMVLDFNKWGLT
jgi:hypothetical protein